MLRQEVPEHYKVNRDGTIMSPGKFEGTPLYTPYLWDLVLEGEGEDEYDENGHPVTTLRIEEFDQMEFPEIVADHIKWVQIWEDEQGFVNILPLEEAEARA